MTGKIINFFKPKKVNTPTKTYTVWVGGTEVNDTLLTKSEAVAIATVFIEDDYDDVCVFNVGVKE